MYVIILCWTATLMEDETDICVQLVRQVMYNKVGYNVKREGERLTLNIIVSA